MFVEYEINKYVLSRPFIKKKTGFVLFLWSISTELSNLVLCACLNQFCQKLQNLAGVCSLGHREKRKVSRETVRLQAKLCLTTKS